MISEFFLITTPTHTHKNKPTYFHVLLKSSGGTVTTFNCVYHWGMRVWAVLTFPGSGLQIPHRVRQGCSGEPTHTPSNSQEVMSEGPLVLLCQWERTVKPNHFQPLIKVACRVREKKAKDKMYDYSGHCFIYTWGETPEYKPPGAWAFCKPDIVGGCLLTPGEPRLEPANMA